MRPVNGRPKVQSQGDELMARAGQEYSPAQPPLSAGWWSGVVECHFGKGKCVLMDTVIRAPTGNPFVLPTATWVLNSMYRGKLNLCQCYALLHVGEKRGEWIRLSCPRASCGLLVDFRTRRNNTVPDLVIDLNEG